MDRIWLITLLLGLMTVAMAVKTKKSEIDRTDALISLLKKYIDEEELVSAQGNRLDAKNDETILDAKNGKTMDAKNDADETEQEVDSFIENHDVSASSERQAGDPCSKSSRPLVLTSPSGTILSPGYSSSQYSDNSICSWKISAPAGKVVQITFNNIDIEKGNECVYDNISIWDVVQSNGIKIGFYCGNVLPVELLRSSGPTMYIYFMSDGVDSAGRFSISWTFTTLPTPPSKPYCGNPAVKPDTTSKIVNGNTARPHSWPWQISLRLLIGTKQYHICGGSIISQNVIACAAHCLFDENHAPVLANQFLVVAGDHDQKTSSDGPVQSLTINKIIYHTQYDPTNAGSAYDIAVFLLSKNLQFNDNVSPICLPTENVAMDSLCYATGWGDTKGTGDETVLNQVRLPIVSHTQCRQNNYYGSQVVDTMLCSGYAEGVKDACQGDSGGPFVCYNQFTKLWYLQGITSWGAECAMPKKPGVYTRVVRYLDWIKSNSGVSP